MSMHSYVQYAYLLYIYIYTRVCVSHTCNYVCRMHMHVDMWYVYDICA